MKRNPRYNTKSKYSLKENILSGDGMGLITEMQLSANEIQDLADTLLAIPGSGATPDAKADAAGNAGELFIQRHLGGTNTDDIVANFPMADIYVGNLGDLAQSGGAGGPGGLVFYSVKASSQTGVFGTQQELNANVMADKLDEKGLFAMGQSECKIRFGVYVLSIDYDNDSVQVMKSDLHTILLKKGPRGWVAVDVQEQTSKLDPKRNQPHPHFNGGNNLRSMAAFASVGLELSEVGVGAFSQHTGERGDVNRVQTVNPDVHDTNKPYGKAKSRRPGFKGSPSRFPGNANDPSPREI
tara:strand:- start:1818 stop:2708 length:891 start_codon:yes stop_codon:yes gene_type:complete